MRCILSRSQSVTGHDLFPVQPHCPCRLCHSVLKSFSFDETYIVSIATISKLFDDIIDRLRTQAFCCRTCLDRRFHQTMPAFLDLAGEVRNCIYAHLFTNLKLEYRPQPTSIIYETPRTLFDWRNLYAHTGIIFTCKQVLEESRTVLLETSSINLDRLAEYHHSGTVPSHGKSIVSLICHGRCEINPHCPLRLRYLVPKLDTLQSLTFVHETGIDLDHDLNSYQSVDDTIGKEIRSQVTWEKDGAVCDTKHQAQLQYLMLALHTKRPDVRILVHYEVNTRGREVVWSVAGFQTQEIREPQVSVRTHDLNQCQC